MKRIIKKLLKLLSSWAFEKWILSASNSELEDCIEALNAAADRVCARADQVAIQAAKRKTEVRYEKH